MSSTRISADHLRDLHDIEQDFDSKITSAQTTITRLQGEIQDRQSEIQKLMMQVDLVREERRKVQLMYDARHRQWDTQKDDE